MEFEEYSEKQLKPIFLYISEKKQERVFEKWIIKRENRWFVFKKFAEVNTHLFGKIPAKKSRICFVCKKTGNFGWPGEKPIYCTAHKLPEMEDVVHKRCQFAGCKKQPHFGHEKPTHCAVHKLPEMEDIIHKRCQFAGCKKQPNFGHEKPTHCAVHKLPEMEDVVSKRCQFVGCKKIPSFGHEKATHCVTHKLPEMENVVNKRCQFAGCKKQSTFGHEKPTHCAAHKLPEMEDIVNKNKRCITPMCDTRAGKKYEGYCFRCFLYLFPEKPNARNYKTKEQSTMDHIKKCFPDFTWLFDKKAGCSGRRPDAVVDLGFQILIIEVDENQHSTEEYCNCENKRIMQISQDYEHRPVVFIRFNPDKYELEPGCWKKDGRGLFVVACETRWQNRLEVLREQVEYWSKNVTDKTVEIIHLFYNKY